MRKAIAAFLVGALFVGGTAEARHLISTHDIKNHAVTWSKLASNVQGGIYQNTKVVTTRVSLAPGVDTYTALGGATFDANCPTGWGVVGTGFSAPISGGVGFVEQFGNHVGAFMFNDGSSGQSEDAEVQAICSDTVIHSTATKISGESALARAAHLAR